MNTYTLSFLNGIVVVAFVWLVDVVSAPSEIVVPVTLGIGILAMTASIVLIKYNHTVKACEVSGKYDTFFLYVLFPLFVVTWPVFVFGIYGKVSIDPSVFFSLHALLTVLVVLFLTYIFMRSAETSADDVYPMESIPMLNRPPTNRIDLIPTDVVILFTYFLAITLG